MTLTPRESATPCAWRCGWRRCRPRRAGGASAGCKESDWRESWKKHFGVQRIGRALVVKPSWTQYRLKGGEIVIEIDPGMAFGTGQHPTTAMCLRALEELVRPGMRVLDLGCGSGILAIAAAKLGAARVLALDIDPNAVRAARENAAANGVEPAIDVREGTLERGRLASDVRHHRRQHQRPHAGAPRARAGAQRCAGGALITSGFLEDAVDGLCARVRGRGPHRRARWSRTASGGLIIARS